MRCRLEWDIRSRHRHDRHPHVAVSKRQVLAAGATGRVGDLVDFSFSVTDRRDTSLAGVTLVDGQPGRSNIVYSWPASAGALLPGQTATASYRLTQADVDAASISSTVTATGSTPLSTTVADATASTTLIAANPLVTIATAEDGLNCVLRVERYPA